MVNNIENVFPLEQILEIIDLKKQDYDSFDKKTYHKRPLRLIIYN